jgi:hypothetical protein
MLASLVALVLAAEAAGPNVTLPLEEYEKLRLLRERPSLTVVELLRVEGSFAGRDLAVSLSGRSSGTLPTATVLTGEGFRLFGCEGDALVSRDEEGGFAVTPLSPRFRARCRLALDGSDRLEAVATRAVLEVQAAVRDGELVASGDAEARQLSVVRRLGGRAPDLAPSVAGRYRVTLLPDETRFVYRLEVRNPNRGHRRFTLELREEEHVESVNAPVAWEAEDGAYRFDLPPGDSAIEVTGRLTGASFTPPVDAALQYLLVESHPLIRADVTSGAKRVGVGEVGLPAQYRGAQAFLLDGGGEVAWKAVRLEAQKTAGFAVPSLTQIFFLGADGSARGETQLTVDNQGAPAVTIPGDWERTFAAIGGEPAFLTRDEQGRLFLPLGQGAQEVLVQDRRPFASRLGFATASLALPAVGVPASRAAVELRYPAEWIPIYEELAPDARLHLLDGDQLFLLAVLLVLSERLLAQLGLGRGRRWALAVAVVVAAAFTPALLAFALALAAVPLAALGVAALVRRLHGARLGLALAAVAVVALVGVTVAAALLAGGSAGRTSAERYAVAGAMQRAMAPSAPPIAERVESKMLRDGPPSPGAVAKQEGGYQGLPARIELPRGERRSFFTRELLAGDAPRRVSVILASARLVAALAWIAALVALGLGVLLRRDLDRGVRAFAARLLARADAPAAGTGAAR